jgi:polyribonucleotide nucleotidyltransferase
VEIGVIDGNYIINPTKEDKARSDLVLTLAGTKDDILMIEGLSNFITESQLLEAVKAGHLAVQQLCQSIADFAKKYGKKKKIDTLHEVPQALIDQIDKVNNNFLFCS